jgi:tetratricopeptide (TPR) repeat protein
LEMPSWLLSLSEIFKGSDGQWNWPWIGTVIAAPGAVIAALVKGAWEVFKFFAERKKADDKNGGTTVTQFGQGTASGRDTTFHGPVTFAPSAELVAVIQRPFAEQLAAQNALIKMLLEKNPSAGPGAEQAVGTAVQSIAQGAAEGDSRLEQALDLLKANKVGEAVPVLEAFADDKEARIEKDRTEAAIAYRNLGAIAGLADPKRALEAYERALALDPDDIESLYWTGQILIDYGDLTKAQWQLEHVQKLADSGDHEFYKFAALGSLGDIKQKRGDLQGALRSYQDGLAIAERLAKADPGNAQWQYDLGISNERIGGQYDLGISNERIGDVQMAQGDLAAALKSYEAKRDIISSLARSNPGNAFLYRDLSVSYQKVGDVLEAQGNLPEALKFYQGGLAIADRLAKSDPGNAGWQRDLSVSYNNIGGVLEAQGNLPEALKSHQDSLAIADRLAKSDPGNALWQGDLSISFISIGDVLVKQGNLPEALKSYQDSLAIFDRLAKSDPGNAEWQRDFSVSYIKIGDVLVAQGDLSAALKSYQDGLAITERLAQSDPGNAEWQRDLIISYKKIADCSPPAQRRTNLKRALGVAQALQASGRLAPADQWMLAELARPIAESPEK